MIIKQRYSKQKFNIFLDNRYYSVILIIIYLLFSTNLCRGEIGTIVNQKPFVQNLGVIVESATLEKKYIFYLAYAKQTHLLLYYVTLQFEINPFQIVDVNLDNGATRVTDGLLGRPGPNGTLLHSNGMVYIGSGAPAIFMVYDPTTGQSRQIGKLADRGLQYIIEGDDGAVYLGEATKGYVERYNPKDGSWENYGIIDDPGPPYYRYAYTLGADGRYVYIAMGENPWYLVIYDRLQKKQKVFWKDLKLRNVTIQRGETGGWFALLINAQGQETWYRLRGDQPPELLKLRPKIGPTNIPANYPKSHNYDLDLARADTDAKGRVTVRWRRPATPIWQEASAQVRVAPMDIKRLYGAPDGNLFGFTSFYGPVFTYDPVKRGLTILGRPQRSLYDALPCQGEWYLAGYPSAIMRYDPRRPWNLSPAGNLFDPTMNPHLLKIAAVGEAKYHYYLAEGADGYVYFGGHHERTGVGGSLGWYNAKTGITGGLREPFLNYDVSDLIAAEAGSKIIFSGHGVEKGIDGRIFIFDVQQKKISGDFAPLPGVQDTGKLLEVAPGMVIGVVVDPPKSIIYKADLQQRQVIWKKEVAGRAFGSVRGFDRRLVKGPDGHIWLYLNNTICRLDPADGSHREVMEAPPAGNLLFFNKELYIYGGTLLRKVSGFSQNISEN